MSKRMKRVFPSDQVLHLWANQAQSEARNPSNNVFFEGKTCYSYGHHYPLGELVEFKGRTVAFINQSGYSNTTAKHIHKAFSAASHLLCLGVDSSADFGNFEKALLRKQDQLIDTFFNHFKARKPWKDFQGEYGIQKDFEKFNQLCDQLGFPKLKLEPDQDSIQAFECHSLLAKERREALQSPEAEAKREKARLRKAELEAVKHSEAIEAWRQGGPLNSAVRSQRLKLLRVKGETVETSGGASVPLAHALRLLALIERNQAEAGERIGHFKLDRVNSETVEIGCHSIALSEARAVLAGAVAKPELSIVSEKGAANERI